jgi:hypothetical protein
MKKIILCLPVILLASACHFGSKDSSGVSASSVVSAMEANAGDAQKKAEDLKKLTPLSSDALKSFFPDAVMGINRSSFEVSNALGYSVGTAEYKKDDTTKYSVAVYDCAGEAGSAFYSMSFLTRMNIEKEDDNGYTKSTDFMDAKSIEEFVKSSNTYTESFVYADRFWVTLSGENTGLDNLKDFAKGIDLDKLKDLK